MRITALVCRSYYSLLRGPVPVQRLVKAAAEYGYAAAALADVNAMYGVVDFCKSAQQVGIKPIIGVEILTDTQRAVLLAEDRAGYKNICRITTARNLNENFDLVEQLKQRHKGLICFCTQSDLLTQLKRVFPKGYLFAGWEGGDDLDDQTQNGVEPIACTTFNCLDDDDVLTARLLSRVRQLSVAGPGPQDKCGLNKLIPETEFRQRFRSCARAAANAEQIAQRCSLRLLNGRHFLPKAKLPKGANGDTELARLCHRGLAGIYKPVNKDIVKRLEYELAVIRKNKFSDYFLVVHEIVNFAKRNSIPVEVRGSAAGSLVSYVLGFTRVCPIQNRLYFERFMNPGRRDCPDIDIDFCWRRRDEVIKSCYEKWGFEHVAMISNINRYRRRSAIRDVGRFLGLQPHQINEFVEQRKVNADSAIYKLAERIIGFPRHLGVHCGGIVITASPVREISPLELAAKGVIVTQYDKDAAEAVGLIKIDLLGNRALSTVDGTVSIISKGGDDLNVDALSPTDEKTGNILSAGDSLGVFQCESPGMRQLLRGLKVRTKKDVAIALSLIRPGPASGGMKAEFIERYVNGKPFHYLHPRMKEVLGDTYGVMLYQEDVMRIAVEVAGYSVAAADRFRSEVSKKVSGARLQKQYADFVYHRADQAGIDRQNAQAIWDQILRFAAYSYCKAHATVYANIAWQTAFLKAHYPQQFYCSLFNNHLGMYPVRVYVWEAMRRGIRALPPHVNKSDAEWTCEGRAVRAGLNIIKGLSHSTISDIIQQRQIALFTDVDDLRRRVKFRSPELQNLIHVGACDGLGPTRSAMLIKSNYPPTNLNQPLLFDIYDCPLNTCRPEYDRVSKLKAELELTGIPFSMHPTLLLRTRHTPAARLGKFINKEVMVAGAIATARQAGTTDGKVMGFVTLEDSSGLAEVTFFPDRLDRYHDICSASGLVWVRGKVAEHLSSITVEGYTCGTAA